VFRIDLEGYSSLTYSNIGQTKYEVVRGIYLKANPDTYADDLMLIPAGKIVKKDLNLFETLPYPTYLT
jgi:hypothetical protein